MMAEICSGTLFFLPNLRPIRNTIGRVMQDSVAKFAAVKIGFSASSAGIHLARPVVVLHRMVLNRLINEPTITNGM